MQQDLLFFFFYSSKIRSHGVWKGPLKVHGLEELKAVSDRADFSGLCLVSTDRHPVTSLDNLFQRLTTLKLIFTLLADKGRDKYFGLRGGNSVEKNEILLACRSSAELIFHMLSYRNPCSLYSPSLLF